MEKQLSKLALLAVKGASPGILKRLAPAIGVTEATIYQYIRDNNSNLTKAAAMQVIREETGLSDAEILEDTPAEAERLK